MVTGGAADLMMAASASRDRCSPVVRRLRNLSITVFFCLVCCGFSWRRSNAVKSPSHRDHSVHPGHGHHHSDPDRIGDDVIAAGGTSLGSTCSDRGGGSRFHHQEVATATMDDQKPNEDEESAIDWDWTSCLSEPIYGDEYGNDGGKNSSHRHEPVEQDLDLQLDRTKYLENELISGSDCGATAAGLWFIWITFPAIK